MIIFPLAPDQTMAQMWSNGARGTMVSMQLRSAKIQLNYWYTYDVITTLKTYFHSVNQVLRLVRAGHFLSITAIPDYSALKIVHV